jgi:predicted  nucleic acid-binding Zn-ribbon protein
VEVWDKIPPKLLIALAVIGFMYTGAAITYGLYKNTPVEIFGIVKFGERDDALRARLVKALAENETKIAPEVYNAALERAKVAESKSTEPNPQIKSRLFVAENEVGSLKVQIKDRDTKIAALEKELAETSKERAESNRTLEATKKELQLSRKELQEKAVQLDELRKKVEEISLANKKRGVYGFVEQLIALEKLVQGTVDTWNESPYVNSYNEIVTGLKRELPTDAYLQSVNPLSDRPATATVAASLRSSVPRLRVYLEQRYLK